MHCSPFANLNFADVSSKPASWTGLDQHRSEELALVKGVRLSRRQDLRYVSGIDMFFAKGIANGADFSYGRLTGANFENAHLIDADFSNAWCADANFHFAQLIRANLVGTELSGADLRGADIMYAKFGRTDSDRGKSSSRVIWSSQPWIPRLWLTGEQLREARGWNLTTLPRKLINELNLPYDHNARVTSNDFSEYHFDGMDLQGISFRNTNLRAAKLCNARLQGVDFAGANLTGADLTGAYLTGAKITKAQVASAVVDENTRLPFFSTDDSSEPPAKHSPRTNSTQGLTLLLRPSCSN